MSFVNRTYALVCTEQGTFEAGHLHFPGNRAGYHVALAFLHKLSHTPVPFSVSHLLDSNISHDLWQGQGPVLLQAMFAQQQHGRSSSFSVFELSIAFRVS